MKKYNSNFKWRGVNVLSATFLLSILLLTIACKKKETGVGKDILPIDALLNSGGVDTFQLTTYTYQDDSVYANRLGAMAIGTLVDPDLGTMHAGVFSQFDLAYLNPNIDASATIQIDSFVLALEFNTAYGQVSKQRMEVYELDEKMYYDTTYLNSRSLATKTQNLVTDNYTRFNNVQKVVVGTDTLQAQIRVNLDHAKALEILQRVQTNPADFASNTAFREYLKGFYITSTAVESGIGMMGSFNWVDKESKITIYYKKNGEADVLDLVASSSTTSFTKVSHAIQGSNLEALLNQPSRGQERFFAKAGRYRAAVEMNSIRDIPRNAIIHSAYLYVPIEVNGLTAFKAPATISAMNMSGKREVIGKSSTGYSDYLKGYMMDIKAFVQDVVTNGKQDTGILISPEGFANTGNRIIFNGPNTSNKFRPKLVITYTEF